jgi:hypothetical protein
MRFLHTFVCLCALSLIIPAARGGAGVWRDGAYLRWYSNDDTTLSIEPLKQFAIGYKPRTKRAGGGIWCEDIPAGYRTEAADVLRRRVIDDEYKLYVSLIILKLYNCHLEHYGLSGDLGDHPKDFEKLNLVHGAYVKLLAEAGYPIEYPLTIEVIGYLSDHPAYLKNPYVRKVLRRTCELYQKRDAYRKNALECLKLLK